MEYLNCSKKKFTDRSPSMTLEMGLDSLRWRSRQTSRQREKGQQIRRDTEMLHFVYNQESPAFKEHWRKRLLHVTYAAPPLPVPFTIADTTSDPPPPPQLPRL